MGRMVQFPGRYWHRLLLAIEDDDAKVAAVLDRWSDRLCAGNVLTDEELEELGPYTRDDMARMLDAVMLVVDEASATGKPFSAWPE